MRIEQIGARFPLVTTGVEVSGRVWQITAVRNQDVLMDAAGDLADFPFGLLLWESAVGLSRTLATQPERFRGKSLLELGAGVGLPGLVAQSLGARVTQTDHLADALTLIRHNAAQNACLAPVSLLADWRTWSHRAQYEFIIGADICYERGLHPELEAIFRANLLPGGTLILTDPGRPQFLELAGRLERSGWHLTLETLPVTLPLVGQENRPIDVGVLTATFGPPDSPTHRPSRPSGLR